MPRKPSRPPAAQEAIRLRICQLAKDVWKGNQRQMALALNLSTALVSKVLNGQPPGEKFIAALCASPLVNPEWLEHGQGLPSPVIEQGSLPISRNLLPGPPAEHRDLLSGEFFPVAPAHAGANRYFLELSSSLGLVQHGGRNLAAQDLLLIDTSRRALSRVEFVNERICVAQLGSKELKLGIVRYYSETVDEPAQLLLETYDHMLERSKYKVVEIERAEGKSSNKLEDPETKRPIGKHILMARISSVALSHLQGVCQHLVRRWPEKKVS